MLQQVRTKTTCSTLEFFAEINERNPSCFHDCAAFLEHINKHFLKKFSNWISYYFFIWLESDHDAAINTITSMLQMEQILQSSNLTLDVYCGGTDIAMEIELPVEIIGKWLVRKIDQSKGNNKQARFLKFGPLTYIQNVIQMVEYLKKVSIKMQMVIRLTYLAIY